jgi:hypothetical protein
MRCDECDEGYASNLNIAPVAQKVGWLRPLRSSGLFSSIYPPSRDPELAFGFGDGFEHILRAIS